MQKKLSSKLKAYRFRILSGFLFCAFLISSWFVFYQKPEYPEALHISLQEQLKSIIQETLLKQKPKVQNFKFHKIWTQATYKQDQISAHFKYSFDDLESINISVEGQALMNRKSLSSSDKYDLWSVDHIQTNNTNLKFQEPITLFSTKFTEKSDDDSELNPKEQPEEQNPDDSAEKKPANSANKQNPDTTSKEDKQDITPESKTEKTPEKE